MSENVRMFLIILFASLSVLTIIFLFNYHKIQKQKRFNETTKKFIEEKQDIIKKEILDSVNIINSIDELKRQYFSFCKNLIDVEHCKYKAVSGAYNLFIYCIKYKNKEKYFLEYLDSLKVKDFKKDELILFHFKEVSKFSLKRLGELEND